MGKSILFLILVFISCKNDDYKTQVTQTGDELFYEDTPFVQEYHEGYEVAGGNAEAQDVRAIETDGDGTIWIATKDGVYFKQESSKDWVLGIQGKTKGPAYDVAIGPDHKVWLATWDGVYMGDTTGLHKIEGPQPPIAKLVVANEGIYALGPYGSWYYDTTEWVKKDFGIARSIRAALSDNNGGLWIGNDVGLYHCMDEKTEVFQGNDDLISAYVTGMDFDAKGNLWVACMGGVTIRNGERRISDKRPENGIANAHVNVVKKAPNGTMWVGTDYGITRFESAKDTYSVRLSKRWLRSNEVRDITFDKDGNAWIATSNGVSAIKNKKMSLKEKADFFYDKLIQRHVREPWIIARSKLTIPGDTASIEPDDDDNDGEFTSNYLAMEAFRYAVTKDPEAKTRAKKAFDFLHYLRTVTEVDGFFARTIIPVSWERSHDMNRTYTDREMAEALIDNPRHKPVEERWHVSKDGKWKWKGDTSSDELCGHLFGYYWYYNLVADEKEKKRVAEHFSKIMDHLIRNDFNLVDVDGQRTKWGVWSPKLLNHDPEWAPERALNSLELLAFLKFTYHITQNEKYQSEYLKLIEEEGYLENAKMLHKTNPAWETYFDIYLALYMYPILIDYEEDPKLGKEYRDHMEQWFQKHRKAKSPFLNFTYNLLADNTEELENSIGFLKDAPLDLVDWHIDNSKREDLKTVRAPILEELQVDLRPPSEYRTVRWDRNPYLATSGDPSQELEPVYWLLPYWMGRYLEVIQ